MASLPQPKFEPKAPDKSSSAACDVNKKIQESDCSNVSTYSIMHKLCDNCIILYECLVMSIPVIPILLMPQLIILTICTCIIILNFHSYVDI